MPCATHSSSLDTLDAHQLLPQLRPEDECMDPAINPVPHSGHWKYTLCYLGDLAVGACPHLLGLSRLQPTSSLISSGHSVSSASGCSCCITLVMKHSDACCSPRSILTGRWISSGISLPREIVESVDDGLGLFGVGYESREVRSLILMFFAITKICRRARLALFFASWAEPELRGVQKGPQRTCLGSDQ